MQCLMFVFLCIHFLGIFCMLFQWPTSAVCIWWMISWCWNNSITHICHCVFVCRSHRLLWSGIGCATCLFVYICLTFLTMFITAEHLHSFLWVYVIIQHHVITEKFSAILVMLYDNDDESFTSYTRSSEG